MSMPTSADTKVERVLVRPNDACRMLACGRKRVYQLLADGHLQSFKDGRARKITVSSIQQYIARGLTAASPTKLKRPA
jgi:excisionase family DNA binding protein